MIKPKIEEREEEVFCDFVGQNTLKLQLEERDT
jgi:hypothetical protein